MSAKGKNTRMIVAGGGTGGHLFPGIAVAQALLEREPEAQVLFVGTKRPFEKRAANLAGFEHEGLTVEGFANRSRIKQVSALFKLGFSFLRAFVILVRFKPSVVLGVGGYASLPCAFAAKILGIPFAVQEQNLVPGSANKLLGPKASRVYAAFENSREHFGKSAILVTGNPVRPKLMDEAAKIKKPQDNGGFTVLVAGGSQGAAGINRAIMEALEYIPAESGVKFILQTGQSQFEEVNQVCRAWGGPCRAQAFFDDMASVYSAADLVVCRAGATTVAELTALGKAAIFIPFPQAAYNHQEQNARVLEQAGAAMVILESQLNGAVLAQKIEELAKKKELLSAMEEKSQNLGKPNAAEVIVEDILKLIGKKAA
ncbi:MAG: undecaprenyldiphospho-muramoylpentapeptide beta-N-acetylglucosaminyltransferase [Desulfatibacillaceae bacterium]|nr:undecaprenyldiphospho-muramoylpentapeptide beta-N-acetylglucosaminyltransferase [Desulfatibacillaceae bacterium]